MNTGQEMWARASRSCGSGKTPRLDFESQNSRLAGALPHERPARAYTLSRSLADKCAPVSNSSPVRKAQNIRLADSANGP